MFGIPRFCCALSMRSNVKPHVFRHQNGQRLLTPINRSMSGWRLPSHGMMKTIQFFTMPKFPMVIQVKNGKRKIYYPSPVSIFRGKIGDKEEGCYFHAEINGKTKLFRIRALIVDEKIDLSPDRKLE